jgi:hypothetical protein
MTRYDVQLSATSVSSVSLGSWAHALESDTDSVKVCAVSLLSKLLSASAIFV